MRLAAGRIGRIGVIASSDDSLEKVKQGIDEGIDACRWSRKGHGPSYEQHWFRGRRVELILPGRREDILERMGRHGPILDQQGASCCRAACTAKNAVFPKDTAHVDGVTNPSQWLVLQACYDLRDRIDGAGVGVRTVCEKDGCAEYCSYQRYSQQNSSCVSHGFKDTASRPQSGRPAPTPIALGLSRRSRRRWSVRCSSPSYV